MPTSTIATTTATGTTPQAVLQNLQTNYGPQAQAVGHAASGIFLAHLGMLQFISVIISIVLFAGTIYFLFQTGWVSTRVDRFQDVVMKSDLSKKHAQATWDEIEGHFFAGDDNDLKIAIIKADTLLDEALQGVGVQGGQLGERLTKVRNEQLPNLEAVWQAHKLRNQIAHEANFVLKRDLAERALTVYEAALEHLGVLDKEGKNAAAADPNAAKSDKGGAPTAPKSH